MATIRRNQKRIRCACGASLELYGDTQCERCGQWYNAFGQRLKDPSQWTENRRRRVSRKTKMNPRTIDITPKWTGLVSWFIRVLEDPSAAENAKKVIREELMRLAKFADNANVKAKSRTLFNRRHRGK